ncbi:MAG: hypothetical protein HOI33_08280 [Rhodospirillaceae bacterium]|jgi:hypothetical protein|nr:hypothetical protein [Rhodospirillaceae bacterium]MBT5659932.1 hypothetical protein [Rhodospirillaceae bacterium]MBT5752691.1 hypothetical protein [Rhodospirillaceae bacterium]
MAVIGKKRPHIRKDHRQTEPVLRLTIANKAFETIDWGFGGFRLRGVNGKIKHGDEITVTRITPPGTNGTPVNVKVSVIRYNPVKKELSCEIPVLGEKAYEIFESILMRRYQDQS